MTNQYNFVFFGSDQDLYKIAYYDVIRRVNVRYVATPYDNKNGFLKFLHKIHFNPRINKYFRIPFKNIWNPGYFKDTFDTKNPICFIFFHEWCEYEKSGLVKHFRKKYPHCKMVCFFQDLVYLQKNIDIMHVKNAFDLVISYDRIDAKKYGLLFHPTVYSKCKFESNNNIEKSNVYYLGDAKKRLDRIVLIFKYLGSIGLKCDFYVTNVDEQDQSFHKGINYIKQMSYEENLQHVLNADCVLEVMQDSAVGYTMRTWEAIMYNKKLITNNIEIINSPFYNPSNILVYDSIEGIKTEKVFFNAISRKTDHKYKHEISPVKFLEFIEKNLEKFN
jgi:1,5-rhamnosyltransferase